MACPEKNFLCDYRGGPWHGVNSTERPRLSLLPGRTSTILAMVKPNRILRAFLGAYRRQVEGIDELAHSSSGMVGGGPILKSRREQKGSGIISANFMSHQQLQRGVETGSKGRPFDSKQPSVPFSYFV